MERGELAEEMQQELAVKALGWYDDNATMFDSCLKPEHRRPIAESLIDDWKEPLETIEETLDRMARDWFDLERSNLVDAANWAGDVGEHQTAVRLSGNLVEFFRRRSLWNDWVTTHEVSLASARAIGDQQGIAATIVPTSNLKPLRSTNPSPIAKNDRPNPSSSGKPPPSSCSATV